VILELLGQDCLLDQNEEPMHIYDLKPRPHISFIIIIILIVNVICFVLFIYLLLLFILMKNTLSTLAE
jgi:hypothetical protein